MLSKIIRSVLAVFVCLWSGVSFDSLASSPETCMADSVGKPPLLIYNQFPRIWNMDFGQMQEYLPVIKRLGFNAVWVNPFMKTSKYNVVLRVNKATGEPVKVVGSLYGMFDPSLTDTEMYTEDSTGNPAFLGAKTEEIRAYTGVACGLGLVPIFDLVLNHVSRDSPLVAGTFRHFLDQEIDTSGWFQHGVDGKWNDVVPFDYDEPGNIGQIFEFLWRPFIDKMIKGYRFSGVRIDFATGPKVSAEVVKMCIDHIKSLVQNAVIFAEDLYPGPPEDRIKHVLRKSRDVGFTHVTNIAMYLEERSIDFKDGYESIRQNLGFKKLMTLGADEGFVG
jgi:hypothetical protein